MKNHRNKVTIGIPVFNEAGDIERCIQSCLRSDAFIIISDNASTDGTKELCEDFKKKFPHIQLLTQTKNKGAQENFKILLENCETDYFMWLGAHDEISPDYASRLQIELDSDPETIMAYGRAEHINLATKKIIKLNEFQELSTLLSNKRPDTRALALISRLTDCTLIHGLWRAKPLKEAWVDDKMLGSDHLILLNAALRGRFRYVNSVTYKRGHPARSNSKILQLERISGRVEISASKKQLCKLSLESIQKSPNISRPIATQIQALFILSYRFGAYSENHIWRVFEKAIFLFRILKNFISSKFVK
jgi:glycosyltransferase involved in cell wall biosynthesis